MKFLVSLHALFKKNRKQSNFVVKKTFILVKSVTVKQTINIALQILPSCTAKHPYSVVDEAIRVIADSGLKYKVTPFETVIEGEYDDVMRVVKQAQEVCYEVGAESLMTYVKIQSAKITDVSIEDKMEKYE